MIVRVMLVGRVSPWRRSARQRRDQALLLQTSPFQVDTLKEDVDLAALASAFLTPHQTALTARDPWRAAVAYDGALSGRGRHSFQLRGGTVAKGKRERSGVKPAPKSTEIAVKKAPTLWCDTCHTKWTEGCLRQWQKCPFHDCKGKLTLTQPVAPVTPKPLKPAATFPLLDEA